MADKHLKDPRTLSTKQEDSLNPVSSLELGDVNNIKMRTPDAELALGHHTLVYTAEEAKEVLRRIDWHILPMLMWVYCIQFADKTSLNYASVMGIRTDVNLDPNTQQYSWVSSIFYAGYIAWE